MTDATDITLNTPAPDDGRPEDDEVQIAQTDAGEQAEVEDATGDAASQAETMVNRPAAGQTVEVPVQPGERYVIDFDPTEAQVVIDGDDFILLFADGGRIVFPNLVPMAESANSPVLEVGGVDIGGDVIIAQARALSGEQPTLETAAGDTAAGPDAQGSGANEYNDNLGDIIDTLNAQPDIPYVQRDFGLIDVEVIDPLLLDEEEPTIPSLNVLPSFGTVSEAFKPQQSPSGTGFNPGDDPEFSDDPGEPRVAFEGTADLGSNEGGVITGLVLEDGTVAAPSPVGASFTTDFDNVTQQLTLTTVNEGDFLVNTPLGNVLYVNVLTGEWQYILLASETHPGVGLSGPDDVLQEVFTYTVTDGFGQTVSSTITVTIEDDAPIANNEAPLSVFEDGFVSASGSVLGNDRTGADGTETTIDDPSTPDDDEIQTVASAGTSAGSQQEVPAGEGGLTIVGSFGTLTIRQDGTYDYSANPDTGGMTDTFVYTIRDADGDEAQATITIDIKESPGGDLIVADSAPQGFIPEDTKTPVTLRAVTGDPDDDDQILTQVILDLPFQVDTTGTAGDQWQLDLGQLETLLGVAEGAANPTGLVTSWTFDEATGVLVINLNPDPSVTDDSLSSAPLDRNSFEVTFDLTPPDDSDVDIEGAEVTASALDTVSGATGSGTGTSDITVDAIVDGSEVLIDADGDPATAPVVITDANNDIGTNVDTPVNLGLSLVLGNDSSDLSNDDAPVQGGTDGSDDADETERVTEVTVQLDQGATLDLTGLDPQPTVSDLGSGVTLYTFDTSDLPVAGAVGTPNANAVSGLIDDFVVIPATGATKDISVVITTTTEEAASSTTNPNGASGQEINDPDNIDIDTYRLTVKVVDIPGGKLEANGDPNGFIPEDVPTNVVLTAAVGDPTDPNEVLTQIVVDFGTPIDLDRSSLDTQWQLEASDLDTIRGLPGVTAVELADGGTVLTITLDPTAEIQTFSADLTLTTPDDSDVDLDGVQVTVTAEDTSVGVTATGTSTSDITVDAIVDGSEVFRNGKVIDSVNDNDDLGTTTDTPVNLGLSLALGFDSTDLANGDAPTQGDTDGSDAGDPTEEVIQVTLQLDQGATVDLSLLTPQPTVQDLGGGVTLYTFDTAGLGEAAVNTLVSKFVVTPATGATGDITVVIETTTRELNTPPASTNAPSGDEVVIADNTDVDTYRLTLKVVDVPGGELKVTGNPDGVIPEDVPTETTLSASVGDPSNPNEVLTGIVVDFKTAIDLDGSNTADQWQLDPADLAAINGIAGVTAELLDGGSVLTITIDPAANIQTFSEILTLTTPDDSDVDLDGVEVTVTARDTSVGTDASGTSTSDIVADAVVDGSEVLRNGALIDDANDDIGTTVDAPVNLGLTLDLGLDNTNAGNSTDPSQSDAVDGSDAADDTETVTLVTVLVDQGATLTFAGATATTSSTAPGETLYSFDTSGLTEAQVSALLASFQVTPATGVTEDINVTVTTTTQELNTPPASTNAPSGDEVVIADNTDVDSYSLTVKVVDVPGGELKVTGNPDGVVPEDVPTDVTLSASVGDPSNPNEVLTGIVVDFKTAIDLDGSNTADQWQLDPADLAAIDAIAGVTAELLDGGSVLTITIDPAANIQTFSEILTLTTPDDSDVDLDGVEVTVTARDTSVGTDASGTSTSDIVADAVVDGSEVLRNGAIINSSNNSVGTNVNAAVLLGLTLDLGLDNTNAGNSTDPSQSDAVDGSDAADDTETVTLVTVLVDQSATLTFAGATATTSSTAPGETLYSFDTSGLTEAQVSALLASFQVTPATGALEDINVTVTTTTQELNTPPASTNAPSGGEVVIADNTDVDSYQLVVKVVGVPGGELTVTGNPDGVVPEDVPTEVTLSAEVGDPSDPNEVLTQIVVDFNTAIDLDGSNTADQWQLDPADLDALRALPGVTGVVFADGGTTLTVNLDPAAGIQTFNGLITLTTPDDSDVDLDGVEVTVTARDTSVGTDASGTSTSDIVADAVIDGSEITFGTPTGLQNQFGPIDLTTELVLGLDSTNAGNSTDPSQSDVTDGTIFADDTEFVSKIEVALTDQTSGDPTGTLNFLDPLPAGITVTSDPVNNPGVWTFEISDSVSSTNVQALVDSFGVTPDFNYSGTINAQIVTTTEELNTPPGNTNPASGDEVNVADNVDVDTYNVQVEVQPAQVNKAVEVSGGEPKPFNIVFVIDRSGSMGDPVEGGGPSRFSVAEEAFRTLISDIRDQGIEVANVRLLGFNTGTLDVTDFTGLPTDDQVDDFFDDLGSPNGGTRYEPPLTSASNFLNDINTDNPDVEYDNRILFLSDGGNNNSDGGFLLGTANGNNNAGSFDELSRLYSNVGEVGDDIPNLTIKSVGFGIDKSFDPFAQDNLGSGASNNVNAYLALDQSDDNMVNGSAVVSNANNGADLAAAFGNIVDPALAEGTLFEGHTFVGTGQLNSFSHFGRIYDASIAVDNANRDAAVAGDVVANTGSAVTIKTENSGFLTIWFADEGGRLEGDFRYEGPPNFPGDRTDTVNYIVQDDVGLQLGQLDINISGQAPANGDFENGNLVDWEFLGSVYLENNADLSSSNPTGDDFVAVLATNNANGLDPRDGGGNANREDEGVVDDTTLEDGNLTPVEDLGKDSNLRNLQLYTEADLETTLAANGDGTNNVDLSGLVADDILDGAVIQTSFQLDPLFGTPTGNQNLEISFDWNFATDEGAGGQNDIAFAVIEGQLFLLGSLGSSTFDGGAIDVGESEITYDRSTGWETATFSLGSDFQDVDGDNVIHIAFGVADAGSNVGENSALLLDNVRADVS